MIVEKQGQIDKNQIELEQKVSSSLARKKDLTIKLVKNELE